MQAAAEVEAAMRPPTPAHARRIHATWARRIEPGFLSNTNIYSPQLHELSPGTPIIYLYQESLHINFQTSP